MIKDFVKAWDLNKNKLEEYIRTHKQKDYCGYKLLVKLLFDIVINPTMEDDWDMFDTEYITVINDGNYQGTLIFVLHKDHYQPCVSDYVYTSVGYGSCSGCDTLQRIYDWDMDLPNEAQIKDYMTLLLHLLQRCHRMGAYDEFEEDDYNG